jgi:predicted RNA-binding Zn ribbon-like protein
VSSCGTGSTGVKRYDGRVALPDDTTPDPFLAPVFVGGRVSLDLVNTVGKRGTLDAERLPGPAELGDWLVLAGLAPTAPPVAAADLKRAHRLREAVHALTAASRTGGPPRERDVALVNETAAAADLAPRLTGGPEGFATAWQAPATVGAALSTIARDAVHLLAGPLAGRLKECANPVCTLVFLDDSQARRRRWCSMERCGNLAKVAQYRSARGRRSGTPPRG